MCGSFNAVAFYLSIAGMLAEWTCMYQSMLRMVLDMLAKEGL